MAYQDAKGRGITHQSSPSRMLKPCWIGRPAKCICLIGGWNSPPSQGWRIHGNLLRKSMPPFNSSSLKQGLSRSRVYCTPCPQVSHPECVSPGQTVLLGHVTTAFSLNHGLCLRITVFCGET